MGLRSHRLRQQQGLLGRLTALALLVLAASVMGACGEAARSAPPGPLDLEAEGEPAARAALLAAANDRNVSVRRARRLGVTQCQPDADEDSNAVYCYVEFTAYPGSLRRFCTRAYRTTITGRTAAPAEGWSITCLRYSSRKTARAARDGKVSPGKARRQARAEQPEQ